MPGHRRGLARKQPPPPPHLPELATARGKTAPTFRATTRYVVPRRPRPHPRQVEAMARARRLRQPRPLRLSRPELHRDHDHPDTARLIAAVLDYVDESAGLVSTPHPSPLQRWVLAHHLDTVERATPRHKWGRRHRIEDVRRALSIDRLSPPAPW